VPTGSPAEAVSSAEVPVATTRQWQDLKVRISGAKVEGYLNGKLYLEHTLPAPVSGKIGVWSKADSVVYFDDYRVVPAPQG